MPLRDRIADWLSAADARTLPGLYAAVSIRPTRTAAWLRGAGKPFVDGAESSPSEYDLELTAQWVTQQSRLRMALVGGLAGLGGMVTIPPEAVASMVAAIRLAQRLAVVYGFDPATDRGEMAVWQAVAAGFQVELPQSGAMGLRVSSLPGLAMGRPSPQNAAGALAIAVAQRSAFWVGKRFTRWFPVPVLSSGFGARAAERRLTDVGRRMSATLGRLAIAPVPTDVHEAVEVDAGR
jgi:hypothetical protein